MEASWALPIDRVVDVLVDDLVVDVDLLEVDEDRGRMPRIFRDFRGDICEYLSKILTRLPYDRYRCEIISSKNYPSKLSNQVLLTIAVFSPFLEMTGGCRQWPFVSDLFCF